jgi:hypothetical protein
MRSCMPVTKGYQFVLQGRAEECSRELHLQVQSRRDARESDLSKLAFFDRPIWTAFAENKSALRVYREQSRRDG